MIGGDMERSSDRTEVIQCRTIAEKATSTEQHVRQTCVSASQKAMYKGRLHSFHYEDGRDVGCA